MAGGPLLMEEPLQQEAEESLQYMGLANVPAGVLDEITRHLASADRANWRLVNKAARQAVYDSTTALAPCYMEDLWAPPNTTALLPQIVAKCSNLQRLSCERLPNLDSIAGLLQLPPSLESLDISNTDVADLAFIARCTSLMRLKAKRALGCAGPESRQLAAVLQQLPRLTALDLTANELSVDAARDIAAVLQNLTELQELSFEEPDPVAAAAALTQAAPHLQGLRLLNLSCCFLGGEALLPAILQLTRLQQLDLTGNALGAAGALNLAPALRELKQLETLDLCSNGLTDNGVAALEPTIQQLTSLKSLSFRDNNMSLAGAQALAATLRHLTRLQHLDLSSNFFGHGGAALLAPGIQALPGLLHLNLGYNASFGWIEGWMDDGTDGEAMGVALASALLRLTALQHLNLEANGLGPAGLRALLPGIQQLANLRVLNLRANDLDREGLLSFAAGIQQLTALEELVIAENESWDEEFKQALAAAIQTSSPGCKIDGTFRY